MNIIKKTTPNCTKGRNGFVPDMIVCHITDGNYPGCVSWMENPAAGASAHFCVSRNGEIVQLVEIEDTAWGNGTSTDPSKAYYFGKASSELVISRKENANRYTVSIEHEGIWKDTKGELTTEQLVATCWLMKYISSEIKRIYGTAGVHFDRAHIIGHNEVSPLTRPNCPGQQFPWDKIIKNLNGADDMEKLESLKIRINGVDETVQGFIIDGRTYAGIRELSEKLGYDVNWNDNLKTVELDLKK